MENCKPARTPVSPGLKLLKATDESDMADATYHVPVCSWQLAVPIWLD